MRLSAEMRQLVDYENRAISITAYSGDLIPSLLQTADYARASMLRDREIPAEEIDERVAIRIARQDVFDRPDPGRYTFFVHERALLSPIGDNDIMARQLRHLARVGTRPQVSVRVVPASSGTDPRHAEPFALMEFADAPPVVYVETETTLRRVENLAEVPRDVLRNLGDR